MQIKPTGWEFTGADFCCDAFKVFASTEGCGSPDFKLDLFHVVIYLPVDLRNSIFP